MEIPLGACPTTVNSSVFSLVLVNFPGEIPAFDPGFACQQIPLGGFSLVVFFCPYICLMLKLCENIKVRPHFNVNVFESLGYLQ